jgi:hypothetical protein
MVVSNRFTFALPLKRNRAINRRAPTRRGKGNEETNMTNAEATTAADVAEQGTTVAPQTASSKKRATQKQGSPRGQKTAKAAKKKAPTKKGAKAAKKAARGGATEPRPESKGAKVLQLIGRAKGATLAEIVKVTGWQKHTIRGFVSIASKKHAINIESAKNEAGERVYSISN